jgi:hypothetical protein
VVLRDIAISHAWSPLAARNLFQDLFREASC